MPTSWPKRGAYSLALASMAPDRVRAVVACCAMSDMRHQPSRDAMSVSACHDVWDAPDRSAAIEVARAQFGDDGSRLMDNGDADLCAADLAFITEMASDPMQVVSLQAQFANGVQGYIDDWLADGPGWVSFDVTAVVCPVLVLHGSDDTIVDVVNAHHTVSLVPQASPRIEEGHGHLSIAPTVIGSLMELVATTQ